MLNVNNECITDGKEILEAERKYYQGLYTDISEVNDCEDKNNQPLPFNETDLPKINL